MEHKKWILLGKILTTVGPSILKKELWCLLENIIEMDIIYLLYYYFYYMKSSSKLEQNIQSIQNRISGVSWKQKHEFPSLFYV